MKRIILLVSVILLISSCTKWEEWVVDQPAVMKQFVPEHIRKWTTYTRIPHKSGKTTYYTTIPHHHKKRIPDQWSYFVVVRRSGEKANGRLITQYKIQEVETSKEMYDRLLIPEGNKELAIRNFLPKDER